jgi:hypothetical protein
VWTGNHSLMGQKCIRCVAAAPWYSPANDHCFHARQIAAALCICVCVAWHLIASAEVASLTQSAMYWTGFGGAAKATC